MDIYIKRVPVYDDVFGDVLRVDEIQYDINDIMHEFYNEWSNNMIAAGRRQDISLENCVSAWVKKNHAYKKEHQN